MELILGIDLGTTYSCVAWVDETGKPQIIKNKEGFLTTPSVVFFRSKTEQEVGDAAKQYAVMYPDRVVSQIKRHMGEADYSVFMDGADLRPEEISAHILRKLVQDAVTTLREEGAIPADEPERIAAVINEAGFAFTPEYFISIHAKLFKGVIASAGKLRTINFHKHEWVLKEDSVTYGDKATLKASLVRDFLDEREFDYGTRSVAQMIPHFVRFIAQIWQVHPFAEGNTRTTAVFAIKYLRSLGHCVTNNMFVENSWYFRNALVRANYADYEKNVKRDWSYLEKFFRNLLLGEKNELKSRYLLIGLKRIRTKAETTVGCQKKVVRKGCQKTVDRLVELLKAQPHLTQVGMSAALGISRQAVQKHIANLKKAGRLLLIGPDKGGHWEAK